MTEMLVIRQFADVDQFKEAWNCLRKQERAFFPKFEDLVFFLLEAPREFRIIAIKEGDRILSLACFVWERAGKQFSVGERNLFSLPIRRVRLFGSAILGNLDLEMFEQFMKVIVGEFIFDVLSFGEVPIGSPLYSAIRRAGLGFVATSPSRKASLRWLINLPKSFDEYLGSLSSKLRKTLRYQARRLENELHCEFVVVQRENQIDAFLRDGESVSRLTYQWNVGQRLNNDEATRRLCIRRARDGQLRCYLVYIEGKPVAFARGVLVDGVYNFETPGFDPRYSKFSVGLVLLVWVIRDLIESTDCHIFDFGEGGDEADYKSRFGNACLRCVFLELVRWTRPRSLGIVLLQEALTQVKNVASWLIGDSKLRVSLKKAIRKYGAPKE